MQYVNDGRVLVSFDSIAADNAASASGFVGTLAPHATMISGTSDAAASEKSGKCRFVMRISFEPISDGRGLENQAALR
jgi:hypothetical protein